MDMCKPHINFVLLSDPMIHLTCICMSYGLDVDDHINVVHLLDSTSLSVVCFWAWLILVIHISLLFPVRVIQRLREYWGSTRYDDQELV